jgi:beta-glucosidase
MTFPLSIGQIPVYYNAKNTGRPFHDGDSPKFKSDYLDISNDPLYPFGYGLSYTKFTYSSMTASADGNSVEFHQVNQNGNTKSISISNTQPVSVKLTVTNTGNYDGEEIVQLYIRDMVASVTQPVMELKKFQKVYLKKGESKEVRFTLSTDDLKFVNSELKWVYEPGAFKVFVGTNSKFVVEADLLGK